MKHTALMCVALLVIVPAARAQTNDSWWVPTKSNGCVLAGTGHTAPYKGPAEFILTLKHLGRDYSADDERDAGGRIVGTVIHDNVTGGGMAFYRTQQLCAAVGENYRSDQQKDQDAIKDKYR
jgi:hypothetical protein